MEIAMLAVPALMFVAVVALAVLTVCSLRGRAERLNRTIEMLEDRDRQRCAMIANLREQIRVLERASGMGRGGNGG
jgi:hypothetical protein